MNAPDPNAPVHRSIHIPPVPFVTQRPAMVQAASGWRDTVAIRPAAPLRWRLPASMAACVLLLAVFVAALHMRQPADDSATVVARVVR